MKHLILILILLFCGCEPAFHTSKYTVIADGHIYTGLKLTQETSNAAYFVDDEGRIYAFHGTFHCYQGQPE